MVFDRRIRINDRNYYIGVELKYDERKLLCKSNGTYFDMGDFGIMIDFVEKKYKEDSKEIIYDKDNAYMNDVIYLYDRFPFASYIKDITFDDKGNIVYSGVIYKEEIDEYIKDNNIELDRWDKENCICPVLYQ